VTHVDWDLWRRREAEIDRARGLTRRADRPDRETQGAIDLDAALEGYVSGYVDPEELLRAAALVLGSSIPLDEERPRPSPP
jgi:hypothetical protein